MGFECVCLLEMIEWEYDCPKIFTSRDARRVQLLVVIIRLRFLLVVMVMVVIGCGILNWYIRIYIEEDIRRSHLNSIKLLKFTQQVCVRKSIGRLVVSYLQNTKHRVVYVAVVCRLRLRAFLQLSSYISVNSQAFSKLAFISDTEDL